MSRTEFRRRLFAAIALAFVCHHVLSQEMIKLTVDDGLSQGFVTSIVQDKAGFIWVGTLNGLNRYDGYDFKVYRNDPGKQYQLLSNTIRSVYTDEGGRLWIVCQDGVQYYDEKVDGFVTPAELNHPWKWKNETVLSMEEKRLVLINRDSMCEFSLSGEAGNVSFGTEHSVKFPSEEFGNPYSLLLDGKLTLVGTEMGVCSWDGVSFRRLFPEIRTAVLDIWKDKLRDQICLETAAGIYFFKDRYLMDFHAGGGANYGLGKKGRRTENEYLVTWGTSLWKWNGITLTETNLDFVKDITATCVDRQGNIWIGLDASGIVCVQKKTRKLRKVLNTGTASSKRPLQDMSGGIWLNQKKGKESISVADYGKYSWDSASGMDTKPPVTVFDAFFADTDKNGNIWAVVKSLELQEIKSGRKYTGLGGITYYNADYGVNCLDDGSLLLISYDANRIVFCNPATGAVIPVPDLRTFLNTTWWDISSVCKSASTSPWIWVTGPKGIVGIRPDWTNGKCEIRSLDNNLLPADIARNPRLIFAQTDAFDGNLVWIGSWDGFFLWNIADNTLKPVNIMQGRPEPVFCMAQSEKNTLWLGAQQGLIRYSLKTGESKIFTQVDGLPAREFNRNTSLVLKDGMIVMGTVNGTICFYPDEMVVREKPVSMVVSGVWQGAESLQLIRQEKGYRVNRLPYGTENVMVRFSLLDFTNMKTAQYRFRFSGDGGEWVSNGLKNSVSLAGLTPGRYLLEVQGSLDDGEWSESEFLYFEVARPWWATWWAISLLALMIGVPTLLIIRNRRLLIREKHQNELLRLESEHEAVLMNTKERILTNVAHDLRSPLTLITGLAEKIGGDSDEKIVNAAETIKYQSQELLNMIGQILNLGRIRELGGIPLSHTPLDLDNFLSGLIESFSFHAREKNIRLSKRMDASLPLVYLDENGLRAILGNLLSNALKFTPNGGRVMLEVFVEEESLHLLVRDSGPGIPADQVKFLFQRYRRLDGEKHPEGSGIGLAYAAEMAELMRGHLSWVPPALGTVTGAVFKVSFPVKELEVPATVATEEKSGTEGWQSRSPRQPDLRPLILLVEDQYDMADYVRSILETDYDVIIAKDGQSGLEATIELVPDLVISDVVMPGMSGLDMCRAMRDDIRTSHIPIILLSAKTSDSAVRAGLSSGANLYLIKPFDHEVLKKYVSNSLQLSAQTKQYFETHWAGENGGISESVLPDGISSEKEDHFIREVKTLIEDNYSDESFTVDKIAAIMHISLSQLRRKVIALGGESAGVMLRNYRMNKAREMLVNMPEASISEIAFACGFSDPNYFSSMFGKEFGVTPRQFRNNMVK
jgi:signal transduction histidine kinase/DNA-binding response OmpR family regulator